jgi:regulation of enolase protein 1 (concanavalin A-like superfamily)
MLPILLMLLLGIIEGGRIIWAFVTVQNAAREAARYAVTGRPFHCGDLTGPADDPASYCDKATGSPWTEDSTGDFDTARLEAIANVAEQHGLNLTDKGNIKKHEGFFVENLNAPSAFGVMIIGQSAEFPTGNPDDAGDPGWNVRVNTYYNVVMLDPIYDAIMGGQSIHLQGSVELQNEGIDAANQGNYQGGITYLSTNCPPDCGSGDKEPYIIVQDEFGDFTEPAGGQFTVFAEQHPSLTACTLHFGTYATPFVTNGLGSAQINVVISVTAPPSPGGVPSYPIYTTCPSNLEASCAANNDPCFTVTTGKSTISAKNLGSLEQPIEPARWPISSSIPIYLFGHNPNQNYLIKFNGLDAGSTPGDFFFDGTATTTIPTDASFGTNLGNKPAYYIATNHVTGTIPIASDFGGTTIATTTIKLNFASIAIAGETVTSTHPAGDILGIVLRDLAPKQEYAVHFDDGVTQPADVAVDENGNLATYYIVPASVQEPGTSAVPVEIFVLDRGRGQNPNKIARRVIQVQTPLGPFINVPGGNQWPAGSPIKIQIRQHAPNTVYNVRLEQGDPDSPSFSEPADIPTITTDGSGNFQIDHIIPIGYSGNYIIRSFTDTTTAVVADFPIKVTSQPNITIDGGNRWPPKSTITIRLNNHAPLTPYEVWLDRFGPNEQFVGNVITDEFGQGVLTYTIPKDLPTNIDPGYDLHSYFGGAVVADNATLEVNPADLEVIGIDLPDVTFNIELPITLTIRNNGAVSITNTYFDNDIYIDPPEAPDLSVIEVPPGQYKRWINNVPPSGTVTIREDIVLFGDQSHEIYGRTDTSDKVAETNPTNNMDKLVVDGSCPVRIIDDFDSSFDPNAWTQTDFGTSDAGCASIANLPAAPANNVNPPSVPNTLVEYHYNSNTQSFSFAKDVFYGWISGGTAPWGQHDGNDGAWRDGSLRVELGRNNGSQMTGGWSRTFNVATAGCVTIQGYYWIDMDNAYENGEYSEALLAIDDGVDPRVLRHVSGGADTGWVAFKESFSLSAGSHTLILGGANNQATEDAERTQVYFDDIYIVNTASLPPTSSQTAGSGTLVLTNRGSSALMDNDNASNAGYHFMHQTVGSGPFEVAIRLDQSALNGNNGHAGLEIRADETIGYSAKLMFVLRSDNTLRVFSRTNGGSINPERTLALGSPATPIWLRIKRNGDEFVFEYAIDSSETLPADWTNFQDVNFILPGTVEVGPINAPGSASTAFDARFKHFRLCATSAPGGTNNPNNPSLGARCGQVEENGNGLVVIDAINTILNQTGGGHSWDTIQGNDVLGEPTMEGLQALPDSGQTLAPGTSPHATYQVNIQTAGTYYLWVAGRGPNGNGDSVHAGLNGSQQGTVTGFPTGGSSSPAWRQMPGSVNLSAGIHTIDLWAAEDGAEVFKIMLTQDNNFVPPPDGMSQSACTVIVQPSIPPDLQVCSNPVQIGNFEGLFTEVTTAWGTTDGATAFSTTSYQGNRGASFPAFGHRDPSLYQTVSLPSWVLSNTTAIVKYDIGVSHRGANSPNPNDLLRVSLSRTSDGHVLTDKAIATGADTPNLNTTLNNPAEWKPNQSADLFAGLNPLSFLEGGENVRLTFYSPDPAPAPGAGNDTEFFLDNVSLTFCTTQPRPTQDPSLGKLSGKVVNRLTNPLVGADVYAYAYDGPNGPGPVFQTKAIQNGLYSFYNLPPGQYLVYASFNDGNGTKFITNLTNIGAGGVVTNFIMVINTG